MNTSIQQILEGVKDGRLSVEEAVLKLKLAPFEDIGYAKVDRHRALRQGVAEVIYGAGKTPEQIIGKIEAKDDPLPIIVLRLLFDAPAADLPALHPVVQVVDEGAAVEAVGPRAEHHVQGAAGEVAVLDVDRHGRDAELLDSDEH